MIGLEASRERREAELTLVRLKELREKPLSGSFDCRHLQATHAYIFQDSKHHNPGQIRGDAAAHSKTRQLEDESIRYRVDYASHGVEKRIRGVLDDLGGPKALSGLPVDTAAARISRLYGDLDYAHGFSEGNSRTLREFTRCLALEAGFCLDWVPTAVDAASRNRLYIARDILVLERAYPDLTPQRAETTENRLEYEASFTLISLRSTGVSLEGMLCQQLSPDLGRLRGADSREHIERDKESKASVQKTNLTPRQAIAARVLKNLRTSRSAQQKSSAIEEADLDYER